MKIYGYLRVSTEKQDIDNNKVDILKKSNDLGLNGCVQWIQETISGKIDWRQRELGVLFEQLKEGDVIITSELSRFGRTISQIIDFLAQCSKKKVTIHLTKTDFKIDQSIESQVMQFSYGLSAQIERELISSRTKTGLQAAKNKGVVLGRKKDVMGLDKDTQNIKDIQKMLNEGIKIYIIAQKYKVSTQTMYRFIKKRNLIIGKDDKGKREMKDCLQCGLKVNSCSFSNKNPKICRKCVIINNKKVS